MAKNLKFGTTSENFFDLLVGTEVESEIANIRAKNNIDESRILYIYDLACEFYQNYQLKEAEILFAGYAGLNPYDHRAVGGLAAILLLKGKHEKALEVLNVLKTYPTNDFDETILNISLCHYKMKEYQQASAALMIVKSSRLNSFNKERFDYLSRQLNPYL
ncbi:CDC27 family protein [Shewanella waksmanii]|uniref:CDC27 family protein n=1 Tax=Shewanella waksmanii TaxID=213783 RepID=UPI003735C60A